MQFSQLDTQLLWPHLDERRSITLRTRYIVRIEKDWLFHLKKALLLKHSKFFIWRFLEVSLRFQGKMKTFPNLWISAYSVDSFHNKSTELTESRENFTLLAAKV